MKSRCILLGLGGLCASLFPMCVSGQTLAPAPSQSVAATDLQTLARKIDQQNAKIDMLSQQILKLQQQIAAGSRPGVMIGEGAPAASIAPSAPPETARQSTNGNTHVVARGETLTSIAKAHGVSVSDLQKLNHIDNPLKLQAGQTILIPPSPSPAPSSSSD